MRLQCPFEHQLERERSIVRQRIAEYLVHVQQLDSTSFDDLMLGIIENFKYHPSIAFKLHQRASVKNRYNYRVYFHAMELYRQNGAKVDCVKQLTFGKGLCESEIADIETELSIERVKAEHPDIIDNAERLFILSNLERELALVNSDRLIFEGLIKFFSDASGDEMFQLFSESLDYDPNAVYAYTNLGVLNGFNSNASDRTRRVGIKLLERALRYCGIRDHAIVGGFLYHTIAQTYMTMNCTEKAMENIEETLKVNPTMILAMFDKASILRSNNDLRGALAVNDSLIQIHPEDPFELSNIFCNRAVLYYQLKNDQGMFDALHKSISIDPSNSFSYILLSKQAILRNDFAKFEELKNSLILRDSMHVSNYLQHLIEGYSHFGKTEEVVKIQKQQQNYEGSWYRID